MNPLDDYLDIGKTIVLGSHTFEAEAIKAFARKFDPQRFHVDEQEAVSSLFGRLCASGWHTAATWMKYNLAQRDNDPEKRWEGEGEPPVFGPSPGIEKLRWLKPVYAGETITFTRRALGHRPLASRAGWRIMTMQCEAFDSTGDKVLEFQSTVMLQIDTLPSG